MTKKVDEIRAWRRNYVVQGPCARCGGLAHDLHEILAGPHRTRSMCEPACLLRLCRQCHDEIQGADKEYQLALKLLADTQDFNLSKFCEVWGRAPCAIDAAGILAHLKHILIDRG